jgi:hypothetical protein
VGLPTQVTTDGLERAALIVALKHAGHLPLLQERFLAWVEKVEFWQVDDAPEALALIEREVMGLLARLTGGVHGVGYSGPFQRHLHQVLPGAVRTGRSLFA